MSKINVKPANQSVISSVKESATKLSLPPLLSFQDAWAQNKDGARVFKVTRGDPFLIMATLRVQAQPMSNPILPVNVGFELVHIYVKDITPDKKSKAVFSNKPSKTWATMLSRGSTVLQHNQ